MTKSPKFAFIRARWHAEIVDKALEGFNQRLTELGVDAEVETFDVPGAFEMPLLAKKLGGTGVYDGIAAAAFVVDGGIYRHDFVAAAVVNGLMEAQMTTGTPVFSVSLTPHHFQPKSELEAFYLDHFVGKGREAADAAVQTWRLHASLDAPKSVAA
ncbi:MAG: riboflavin synthase subunit beta [Rhizobiales bacterium]|nr:riboflavin synthase subunit beta [Hyphomicrobiales bacterium]